MRNRKKKSRKKRGGAATTTEAVIPEGASTTTEAVIPEGASTTTEAATTTAAIPEGATTSEAAIPEGATTSEGEIPPARIEEIKAKEQDKMREMIQEVLDELKKNEPANNERRFGDFISEVIKKKMGANCRAPVTASPATTTDSTTIGQEDTNIVPPTTSTTGSSTIGQEDTNIVPPTIPTTGSSTPQEGENIDVQVPTVTQQQTQEEDNTDPDTEIQSMAGMVDDTVVEKYQGSKCKKVVDFLNQGDKYKNLDDNALKQNIKKNE